VEQPSTQSGSLLDDAFLQRLERLSLLARRPASGGAGGEHRSRARAESTEFVDYRAYVPGDDLRRLDWNAYRRLGALHVKLAEAREHLPLHLLVDCSASMDWGAPNKLTCARWVAAALGYLALGRNDLVSVACLGHHQRPAGDLRGRGRTVDLLRLLDQAAPVGRIDLAACVRELLLQRRARAGGLIALFTDALVAEQALADTLDCLLAAQCDVVLVQVLSPQELEPEPGGDLEIVDAETAEVLQVGLSQAAVDEYRRRVEAWLAEVETACWRRGLRYLRVRTDEPLESVVLTRLREARVLA
jgi:uncharacterized protein (DUF58 family)